MPSILNKTPVKKSVCVFLCVAAISLLIKQYTLAAPTDPLPFLRTIPETLQNFYLPRGIEFGEDGYVYVVDSGNNTIQMISPDGVVEAAWGGLGSGDGAFDSPTDIAVDGSGNLYVTDTDNNRVEKFNSNGDTLLGQWGSSGPGNGYFGLPTGVAVDPSGDIWVVDTYNNRVQKFDSDGNYLTQFGVGGTGPTEFDLPTGIDIDTSGNIYVVDSGNDRVQKFDLNGLYLLSFGSSGTGDGEFDGPGGIVVNELGQVFVSDYYNNRVLEFESDGDYVNSFGGFGDGDGLFNGPTGVAWYDGQVVVVDRGNNRIQAFDGNTYAFIREAYGASNEDGHFSYPMGLGLTKNGYLYIYVADTLNDRIQKVENSGNFVTKWGGSGTGDGEFDKPVDAAVDGDGDVYVVDRDNNRIQKFGPAGNYIRQWGGPGSDDGEFANPNGVAINGNNYVYIADTDNDRIQEFDKDGTFIRTWGSNGPGDGFFSKPMDIAFNDNADVYVTDSLNNRVQKFTGDGTYISQFGSPGDGDGQFNSPLGIVIDDSDNIYVSDQDNFRVQKFDNTGAYLTEMGSRGPTDGYFGTFGSDNADYNHGPYHIGMDGEGRLYATDPANNRIQIFGEGFSEDSDNDSDTHIKFTQHKSSRDWYENGTRVKLSVGSDHEIKYQWVKGEDGHPKDNKWKIYKGSIKARTGKNTLYWKADGDTHSRYIKVKSKDLTDLISTIDPNTKTVTLSWSIQNLADISEVKVFRDAYTDNFTLDSAHLVGTNTPSDTTFIVNNPNSWRNYYYRVIVHDQSGNDAQNSLIFVQVD